MLKKCFFLFFFPLAAVFADPKICLNMIVKNESKVIERCLTSVMPWIDYWVIVDTGSTDGTQEIIKKVLKKFPGELHQRPWVNFSHNRQEALELAKGKGDYLLFIDADETLTGILDKKNLDKDGYMAKILICEKPIIRQQRALLVNNHIGWNWEGVLHERLYCSKDPSVGLLDDMELVAVFTDGSRSQDTDKYKKDAEILEKAIVKEPNNATYMYYLGQSYYNAKNYTLALKSYQKRAEMGGWDEEVFWSKYMSGTIQQLLQLPPNDYLKSYSEAFAYRSTRAEPLYRMADFFQKADMPAISYVIAKAAANLPKPSDITYIEDWIYSFGSLLCVADSSFALRKWDEAKENYKQVLLKNEVSEEIRKEVNKKLEEIAKIEKGQVLKGI